jgi:carboxyl-terminal processing protease
VRKKAVKQLIVLSVLVTTLFIQTAFVQGASSSENIDVEYLKSVMDMIKDRHKGDVTDQQLIEGALKGMFDTMDQYTTYFTNDEADMFLNNIDGTYEGIGIMMEKRDDYIIIAKVFSASPAEKSGLMIGDKITAVNGKSMVGAVLNEASSLIKGEADTTVILSIIREGENAVRNVEVVRGEIKINPVTYYIREGIGYIKLDLFNANTSECINEALDEMDSNNVSKIILDLRNNPGGSVDEAVKLARNFVPEGLITTLDFKSESLTDREYISYLHNPKYEIAVLVNEMSASASEIVAGAIQDTKAGVIIGTQTFGKAKVQSLIPLLTPDAYTKYEKHLGVKVVDAYDLINKYRIMPKKSEVIGWTKMTTGVYTTPKGRMIDGTGITPDIIVKGATVVEGIDVNSIDKLTVTWKPDVGSEGVDIYNAEKILRVLGYSVDVPDSRLDEKTYNAISKFRTDNGLYPGGVLDFTTQKTLNDKLDAVILKIDKQYSEALDVLGY